MKPTSLIKFLFFTIIDFLPKISRRCIRKNTILLIRLDGIGDFILWLDAAKEFRRLYPADKYKIILLANSDWVDLAKSIPYWDEVWSLNQRKFLHNIAYRLCILKAIRKEGFAVAINPTFSRQFLIGDAIIKVSGAKERLGSVGNHCCIEPWQKRISDRWYTRLVPSSSGTLMELRRNTEFMEGLGLRNLRTDLPNLSIQDADSPLVPENFYILFIGARSKKKMWPLEKYALLANEIYQQTGWHGIVCGGTCEAAMGRELVEICKAPLSNFAEKTSLKQMSTLIKKACFMVSNDTGAVHMAAAVGTPVVCVLGGGHYGRFLPYQVEQKTTRPLPVTISCKMDCFGCNWQCKYKVSPNEPVPCVKNISVDSVWNEVYPLIEPVNAKVKCRL